MSVTLSFRLPSFAIDAVAGSRRVSADGPPARLSGRPAGLQRRRAHRHMARALHELGHAGLLEDFRQAMGR